MGYTLITKQGTVMQFYVQAVAEMYRSINGGVIVTTDILEAKETVCESTA